MRPKRQGIIVWFRNRKNIKQIKRYGHLIYATSKLKYALIYVDQDEIGNIEKKLNKQSFVIKTERSFKPHIHTEFDKTEIAKPKEYDYHIGI